MINLNIRLKMKKEQRDKYDQTYGIFKFKVPLPKELESAMGLTGESTQFKKMIMSNYDKFYDTISPPEEGDWLMTHKEYGQTYQEYIRSGCIQVDQNRDTIYIAPLPFNQNRIMDKDFITNIFLLCEAYFYGMKIRPIEIERSFNTVEAKQYDNGKVQINAEQFLSCLSQELPPDAFCLVGIIDTDLYSESMTKEGKVIHRNCSSMKDISKRTTILSITKYDPLVNMDQSKTISKEKKMKLAMFILKRVCKAVTKEICHMFGMKNCTFFSCNMNGTGSLSEFDSKPFELCPICLRKLISNINCKGEDITKTRIKNAYAVYDRFVKIRDVLQENFYGFFDNEISWLNARIDSLKDEI